MDSVKKSWPCVCLVYQILWSCGKLFRQGELLLSENRSMWHLRLSNIDKSAIAQHGWATGHEILEITRSYTNLPTGKKEF